MTLAQYLERESLELMELSKTESIMHDGKIAQRKLPSYGRF
jgi:hypothetical protein